MLVEKGWFIPTLQFGCEDVFLVEDWDETPAGPYKAVFHFTPEDYRTLYVNSEAGRDLVSTIHRFDEMRVTAVDSRRVDGRWSIEVDTGDKGDLRIEVDYRETPLLKAVNLVARRTPDVIARNPLYCGLLPRLAAPILGTDPSQKLMGVTEMGRNTRFRLERVFKVESARCVWGGNEPGPLVDCCFKHDMGVYSTISKAMVSYLYLFVD
ncbi:MAG: hypothetical protein HPY75_11125 [Actinobacteria bacterium]|nr:hypothetical protein [Actinomycetota bacterium]